jgi:two-component sensor histidine kinase
MMLEDLYRLLRAGHVQAQGIVDTMTQPIVVLDPRMCVITANNAHFEVERDDLVGEVFFELGNGQWDIPELRRLVESVIPKAAAVIGFEVKHDYPSIGQRTFLVDARRLVHPHDNSSSILVLFDDVTERQRLDVEKDFIISETRHRMKNIFAVVRALAMRTEAEGMSALDYRDRFLARLEATLRAQEIAAISHRLDLETLIKQSVGELHAAPFRFDGPKLQIQSANVVTVSMIFHELATNASKYGALSVPGGTVGLSWGLEEGTRQRTVLCCEWKEEGGPSVNQPARRGYGTELLENAAAYLGGSMELRYEPQGLIATFKLPM